MSDFNNPVFCSQGVHLNQICALDGQNAADRRTGAQDLLRRVEPETGVGQAWSEVRSSPRKQGHLHGGRGGALERSLDPDLDSRLGGRSAPSFLTRIARPRKAHRPRQQSAGNRHQVFFKDRNQVRPRTGCCEHNRRLHSPRSGDTRGYGRQNWFAGQCCLAIQSTHRIP